MDRDPVRLGDVLPVTAAALRAFERGAVRIPPPRGRHADPAPGRLTA
ncbi:MULTISPECIES: hypothetical protein [Streptomyces]|uniref:Uncharacterized protein n=1 Tax=Streptomyces fradiae ATCC 10745 = DSM 40063 TaxID=1319510 RepID=A0ABQ6XLU6_STRFR|nr:MULTISPECIES: hypothetical protein [Streptomyces]KAF0646749.1 hypothetical protein K701_26920 [Streptomyces fradiae ATCC 10745 = DSM 40063]UQS31746.1 hypothetical protein J5J01_09070 [Streptomyces fradiae]